MDGVNNSLSISKRNSIKTRHSNLELYLIIVMLMIVAHHYVANSGLFQMLELDPLSARSIFFCLFGAWGKTGVNCFVLITGYFMCTSKITLRKFLKLILQVYFYNIIIWAVFLLTGYADFSLMEFVKLILPIKGLNVNFTCCFLIFFLTIPFLNILVSNMCRRQHILLIALCLFCYSLLPLIHLSVAFNYVTWFCILYLISSFLRLYPLRIDGNTRIWGWLTLGTFLLGAVSVLCVLVANKVFLAPSFGKFLYPYSFISDSNQLLSLAIAICSFMWFKNLKVPQSRFINTIAASTFGVLLIHANSATMRQWLWIDVVDCIGHYNASYSCLYSIGIVLLVFSICSLLDIFRQKMIENPAVDFAEKCVSEIVGRFSNKV